MMASMSGAETCGKSRGHVSLVSSWTGRAKGGALSAVEPRRHARLIDAISHWMIMRKVTTSEHRCTSAERGLLAREAPPL